jgi:membrane peptidoglycan carboxypeptidase
MESNLRDDRHDNRCESLSYGVAHSNNAILGKLAFQNLDPHKLAAAAEQLHWTTALPAFGGAMGKLELPDDKNLEFARDAAGFITDDDANHDLRGAHLSAIGGALIAATFANDGARPAPQLVASIDGTEVPRAPHQRAIPAATAHAVAKMMEKTCSIGSAAKSFRRRRVHAAGKTGTLTRTEPFYMQHSWFVGFAPADHPEIVVAVVLGNPERWYLRGHEAARRLIDRATRREKGRTRSNRS